MMILEKVWVLRGIWMRRRIELRVLEKPYGLYADQRDCNDCISKFEQTVFQNPISVSLKER